MSELVLTKTRMAHGVWEGIITGSDTKGQPPEIRVNYLDQPVEGVELTEEPENGYWFLKVPLPKHALADGVQTFLILDARTDSKLGSFTLIAGEPADDDLRAEVELLRAELDMLKRAFRRHCLETLN